MIPHTRGSATAGLAAVRAAPGRSAGVAPDLPEMLEVTITDGHTARMRPISRPLPLLALALIALSACEATPAPGAPADASSPPADLSDPRPDAATSPPDAAAPPPDAAQPDVGSPAVADVDPVDAGPPADAPAELPDAATPSEDVAPPPADTASEDTAPVLPEIRPPVVATHTSSLSAFTLEPGRETTRCVIRRLDNATALWVTDVVTRLAPGSHHLIVYKSTETEERATPFVCDPFVETLRGETFPIMITQVREETLSFPPRSRSRASPRATSSPRRTCSSTATPTSRSRLAAPGPRPGATSPSCQAPASSP
jgi:hypothetical protein